MDLKTAFEELSEEKLREIFSNEGELLEDLINSQHEYANEKFYRFIIHFLTNMEFSEEDAKKYYFEILENKYLLSEKMDRDIGLRVAALDYFFNVTKILKNPKIVEITLFEEILKMSKEDSKTGCYNAKFLSECARREVKRAERYQQALSILMIDLDDFKKINSVHGHLFADKLLKKFAEIIKANLREEDLMARFGGDEFIILMPQTGRIGARSLAERIKIRLMEYFADKEHLGKKINLTFSGGIATYPFDSKDYDELILLADKALYKSKFLGKNRIYDYLEKEYMQNFTKESERRIKERYHLKKDSYVEIGDKNDLFSITGKIADISQGGFLLECTCEICDEMINNSLGFKIKNLGLSQFEKMEMDGNVIRVNKEHEKLKFYLGVSFNGLLDESIWAKAIESGDLVQKKT